MEEPENIVDMLKEDIIESFLFSGKKVLVSAGPTHEPIDPVRFIGNHSSGKMGVEIALAFADQGAAVTLVLGPSFIEIEHPLIEVIRVTTAGEMFKECTSRFSKMDITVMSAAVADFTPEKVEGQKIKKVDALGITRGWC